MSQIEYLMLFCKCVCFCVCVCVWEDNIWLYLLWWCETIREWASVCRYNLWGTVVVWNCLLFTWRKVSYFPWIAKRPRTLSWYILWTVTNCVEQGSRTQKKKKSLNSGEPWTVEKGDLWKQGVVFLLLSCRRAERQCIKAAVCWYQWQCKVSVV